MRYCFIINPASGKGHNKDQLGERISKACSNAEVAFDVLYTKAPGDMQKLIASYHASHGGEQIRFYACGGDGTLCEAVNGIMALDSRDDVSLGVIPVGTGNDFIKSFGADVSFLDIDAQINAEEVGVDLLRCNDMYSVNITNVGFDCEVVVTTDQIKKKRFIPSKLAYILGVLITLIKKPGVSINISVDGGKMQKKELLLTTFANGRFYGGGFNSNPFAYLNDGRIDVMHIKDVSRMRFISLIGKYTKGTHVDGSLDDIISVYKAKECYVEFPSPVRASVDGEIVTFESMHIRVIPQALSFLVPAGVGVGCLTDAAREEHKSAAVV